MPSRRVTEVRCESVRGQLIDFCALTLDGTKITVEIGQTDVRNGVTTTRVRERSGKRFGSVEDAEEGLVELVAYHGQHYPTRRREARDVEGLPETLATSASDPALEAEVHAGHAGAALVYADWLQTRGDPRGEHAALVLAGKTAAAAELLALHPTRLFGELDVELGNEVRALDWSRGFLAGASLRCRNADSETILAELARAFLALPVSEFVTHLRFGLENHAGANAWTDTIMAVVESRQAARLRSLRFDDYTSSEAELSQVAFGDLSRAWRGLPALEELVIKSGQGGVLGELVLPSLTRFVRESGGLSAAELRAIVTATWPRLEHLAIWFGRAAYGAEGTAEMLAPFLGGEAPATLVHLGLVNAELTHELIGPLARSPIVPRLRSLDLSKGVLNDDDVDDLLAHADAFAHLERLDLSENQLDEGVDEIQARLPNAILADQRADAARYAAVGE